MFFIRNHRSNSQNSYATKQQFYKPFSSICIVCGSPIMTTPLLPMVAKKPRLSCCVLTS